MGYIIPNRDLTIEQKRSLRKNIQEAMISQAVGYMALDPTKLTIRELLPQDLGLRNWAVTRVTDVPTPWVQFNVNNNTILSISSILNLSPDPHITDLRFIKTGGIIGKHNLLTCYAGLPTIKALQTALLDPTARDILDRMSPESIVNLHVGMPSEGYFSEPYVYSMGERCDVFISGVQSSMTENLVLGGFVVEPKGMTII